MTDTAAIWIVIIANLIVGFFGGFMVRHLMYERRLFEVQRELDTLRRVMEEGGHISYHDYDGRRVR